MLHQYKSSLKLLRPRKQAKLSWAVLEAIYEGDDVFKFPKLFQCDNGCKFKSDVTKLLEKDNPDI